MKKLLEVLAGLVLGLILIAIFGAVFVPKMEYSSGCERGRNAALSYKQEYPVGSQLFTGYPPIDRSKSADWNNGCEECYYQVMNRR